MEKTKRLKRAIVILILACVVPECLGAGKNSPKPDDLSAIELLISAHYSMKRAEEAATIDLTLVKGEHEMTKSFAQKYNETRTMLNERLADVGSYLSLLSQVTTVTMQLKNLGESYADFTKNTYNHAKSQPYLLTVYIQANAQIASEIKHIAAKCADYTLFQTNVLKATMAEKQQMIGFIKMHIASVQRIINNAGLMCRSMLSTGIREYRSWEIVNTKTNAKFANEVISKWKQAK